MQPIYYNIPFVCIFMCMVGGITMPLQKSGRTALRTTVAICLSVSLLCGILCGILWSREESFVYLMGHFTAPWGNELYVGPLEAFLGAVFALVMAMSLIGGRKTLMDDILPGKQRFYFTMMAMIMASLLALSFTNDIFTGYVFIEISTLAACAIVMARDTHKTIAATIRYLVLSLLGSGLFLIGLAMLYCVTGHLLMP
ncbi:MAG: sodium:proton antiporter, partial [Clostridia bacterium]|nr:sodium:proton antiporter [Clostridia bacterium]